MAKAPNKLCLILYDEKEGIEKALAMLYRKEKEIAARLGLETAMPLLGILVAFRNLCGAIYHPQTISTDYWDKENIPGGPGRTSVIFHPMYMEEKALSQYLHECELEGGQPLVLADRSIAERRGVRSDTSVVAREFFGLRPIVTLVAEQEDLAVVEIPLKDI
jgi:hypothetical protein